MVAEREQQSKSLGCIFSECRELLVVDGGKKIRVRRMDVKGTG